MNLVKDMCDNSEFESLINLFSKANHIYIKCFDEEGNLYLSSQTSPEEKTFFNDNLDYEKERVVINSFIDFSPETIIEGETFCQFLNLKAVAIRDDKKKIHMIVLLTAVIKENLNDISIPKEVLSTSSEAFESSVLLFSEFSNYYFKEILKNNSLRNEIDSLNKSKEELSCSSNRNEVLAEILKGLESEKDFYDTAFDVLKEASGYLSISNAFLIQNSSDSNLVSIHSECSQIKEGSLSEKFSDLEVKDLPFINGRPYTISSDSVLPSNFKDFFDKYKITAGIFLPIDISEESFIYLCFVNIEKERRFTVDDLKFADDTKKVLSSIYTKKNTENSLKSSYSSLDAILENTGCGIVVFDGVKKSILYTNSTYEEMFKDEVDRRSVERVLYGSFSEDVNEKTEFITDKSRKYYSISFSKIQWVDGKLISMGTFNDITDLKNYQKRIFAQANTDYLTGIFNRQKFENDIEREIRDAVRSGDDGTLILINLDDFKGINEGLGNTIGDMLLKEAAQAIRLIAGKRGYAYRLSGDEFAILLPSIYKNILPRLISAVQKRFTQPWQLNESQYYCTMCMGIAYFPKDGTKSENIFQHADFALRVAKKRGKSQVEYYSPDMDSFSKKRLEIESAMHEAVTKHIEEFVVYYQPLIDASKPDYPCIGAEALVRWNSSALGLLYPNEFISIAEYLGLIVPIGEHVLEEATKRCRYWNDFGHPEFRINVNFSMVQLMSTDIVSSIKHALEESGINPYNLVIEVTESLAENDAEVLKEVLANIRALGVRISLDDFGTGYSTFSRLKDMPFDEVKIDKSFTDGIGEDFFSDSFVKNVTDLADSANMDVIVEGVETDKQKNALEDMNIDIIQGYLYDKPLSKEEFENKYLE